MYSESASRKCMAKGCRPWLVAALLLTVCGNTPDRAEAQQKRHAKKLSPELQQADKWQKQYEALAEQGKYEAALSLAEKVLEVREKVLGPNHLDVAEALNDIAVNLQYAKRDHERALALHERALAIHEKTLGNNHPTVVTSLNNLAQLYYSKGDHERALLLLERALGIAEKSLGNDHPDVALCLMNLGSLHLAAGNYQRALPLLERALAIWENALGNNHRNVAHALTSLGELHRANGEYDRALTLQERALAIYEQSPDSNHPDIATALDNIGLLYQAKGSHERALPLHERALAIKEHALGDNHPDVAITLNNLGIVYQSKGDYAQALPLHERALAIWENALGKNHPTVAASLCNLGMLHEAKGDHERAMLLGEQALAIREKILGRNHPLVALSLSALTMTHYAKGEYERALFRQERALAIYEQALGKNHPDVAISLGKLALLYEAKGDYERALSLHERAVAIKEHALDKTHPGLNISLISLAALHTARDDMDASFAAYERALHARAHLLSAWFRSGSEHQRYQYQARLRFMDVPLSFHLQIAPKHPRAARLAMNTILLDRDRVLDVAVDTMRATRTHLNANSRAKLDHFGRLTAELSHLFNEGPGTKKADRERYARQRVELENAITRLDAELTRDNVAYRQFTRDVWVEDIQKRLPRDATLISFFIYRPFAFKALGVKPAKRFGEPHYAAYVVRSSGDVRGIDLGPARAIDDAVARMHAAMAQYRRDAREHARQVDARVMQPVRALIGDARRIYLVPDGPLSFIPFEAMLDEDGHYLVERYSFTYLASERDLVQRLPHVSKPGPAIVIADPRYDSRQAAPTMAQATESRRSREYTRKPAEPLPGTRREAEALRSLLPDATIWTGKNASETALKAVKNPRILHIATHGFFLPDQEYASDEKAMELFSPERWAPPRVPIENGMLRSGLLLAGSNQMRDPGGNNDGVLTALEASNLRLDGTRLVVLSACDTGRGDLKGSQGIYGLRRAFQVAGAQTLVMSLWKVNDEATQELMARYYQYLLAGEGRAEAMRRVRLDALHKGGKLAHPYYWASFVVSGDDSTLTGTPARLALPPRGGCAGCTTSNPSNAWCVLALLTLYMLRRTRRRRRVRQPSAVLNLTTTTRRLEAPE